MLDNGRIHVSRCGRYIMSPTPAQVQVERLVEQAYDYSDLIIIEGAQGAGRTNISNRLTREVELREQRLSVRSLMAGGGKSESDEPYRTLEQAIVEKLTRAPKVFVDDPFRFLNRSGTGADQARVAKILSSALLQAGKGKIIVTTAGDGELPQDFVFPDDLRVSRFRIPRFGPEDYRHIFGNCFGQDNIGGIDFELVYRLARNLSAFHLNMVCGFLHTDGVTEPTTPEVIEMLGEHLLKPDADIREVNALLATNKAGLFCSV